MQQQHGSRPWSLHVHLYAVPACTRCRRLEVSRADGEKSVLDGRSGVVSILLAKMSVHVCCEHDRLNPTVWASEPSPVRPIFPQLRHQLATRRFLVLWTLVLRGPIRERRTLHTTCFT